MAQQLPGPYATRLLADFGTEVIMVEQPPHGDPGRRSPAVFDLMDRGKSSIVLDLKDPTHLSRFLDLARSSRIYLEGFRPGVAHRLGIDYESIRSVRPDVVYCSISAYGQHGSMAQLPAHALTIQTWVGLVDPFRFNPAATGLPLADLASGMSAALLTASHALAGQASTKVDLSMTDALADWASVLSVSGWVGEPSPFHQEPDPGYGLYPTADGWLTLSIVGEEHCWNSLCTALELTDLAGARTAERRRRYREISERLRETFQTRSTKAWIDLLERATVPAGPCQDVAEVLQDPLLYRRGVLRATSAAVPDVRSPITRSSPPSPCQPRTRPGLDQPLVDEMALANRAQTARR